MSRRTIQGVMFAVLAAMCFGLTTPVLSLLGGSLPPFTVATLLSLGVVLASFVSGSLGQNGPPVPPRRLPRLTLSAVLGWVLAPALLTLGLSRASGVAACLLLNLEAVFTAFLGVLLYRERIGWRFAIGLTAITIGAIGLMSDSMTRDDELLGLIAVAAATALWSTDNALNRPLAEYDSSEVMFVKGMVGGTLSALLALATDEIAMVWQPLAAVVACGLLGYGGMERFYLLAQRYLGVARTSSVFAISPFFGAALALLGGAPSSPIWVFAGVVMAFGVFLHATDGGPEPVRVLANALASAPTGPPASERMRTPSRAKRSVP